MNPNGRPEIPMERVKTMHAMYLTGKTMNEVGSEFGICGTVVLYHFKRREFDTRPRGGNQKESQAGKHNGNWKGGRIRKREGYVMIHRPAHPRCSTRGYVYEHTLVAERKLGRSLKSGEVVHHINHRKGDNRPENLAVMTRSEHASLHFGGKK